MKTKKNLYLMTFMKNYDRIKIKLQGNNRYSGFVEPMLDKNIYNLISMVKDFT